MMPGSQKLCRVEPVNTVVGQAFAPAVRHNPGAGIVDVMPTSA